MSKNEPLYVFIDESGDFNFSPNGSKYYSFTAVITHTPWEKVDEVSRLRHSILSGELLSSLEPKYLEENLYFRFHAAEDKQPVRNHFFGIIQKIDEMRVHSIVIQKNRTNPSIREPKIFYSKMVASLIDYIIKTYEFKSLCIFIDSIPVNKEKNAFIGAIKTTIRSKKPDMNFRVYFPLSASNCFLQVSDYINWAIFRKWEKEDLRSYELIQNKLGSPELDMFRNGSTEYY